MTTNQKYTLTRNAMGVAGLLILAYMMYMLFDNFPRRDDTADIYTLHTELTRARIEADSLLSVTVDFKALRDTAYIERTRTITRWRDSAPRTDTQRLDSCIEVGAVVLKELAYCDTALINCLASVRVEMSTRTITDTLFIDNAEQGKRIDKVTKQRNTWRVISAVLAVVVGFGLI